MWRVMAYGRWIVANGLFLSLSCQIKYMIVLFVFGFSISVLILLIFYFVFIPFIKVFFQFGPSITISYMFCFFIFVLILLIFIFFLVILLKFFWLSVSSFNQSFCCSIFFNLTLILLIYYSFCWNYFSIQFNLPIENLCLPSNYFLFSPSFSFILLCDWFFFSSFVFRHLICWGFSSVQSYRFALVFFF